MKKRNILYTFSLLAMGMMFMSLTPADQVVTKEDGMTVVNTTTLATDVEGYAGTTPVKIYIKKNKIERVEVLPNAETPKYLVQVKRALLDKWKGLSVKDAAKQEVDVVTGATYTSEALIENVRRGVNYYSKQKH